MSNNDFKKLALDFHKFPTAGKTSLNISVDVSSQDKLSLAYSPGVSYPCIEIAENESTAFDYTNKGNTVAVISNGTAVLGLGNLGALASKPVMEGKAVLFKAFADVDATDILVDTQDVEEFINSVKFLGKTWGGINLEDIKAPECFIIEDRLKELMDIPVFHDDQHGTAIITVAGMINACHLSGKKIEEMKVVMNGAGAAGIACLELLKVIGLKDENVILCDSKGVVSKKRNDLNKWKEKHAVDLDITTLSEAMVNADVFIGLSVKGAVTKDMVKSMAKDPIIFAMANPDPEITPNEVKEVRNDAIVATGRSDYNNQVNNVMGFPYIFRGALDVHATTINDEMKIAAAYALAELARKKVPEEVSIACGGRKLEFGKEYIIPVTFDSRLISTVSPAVAKAAMDSGVATKPIKDLNDYARKLEARLDKSANYMREIFNKIGNSKQRILFAEGEEIEIIEAANFIKQNNYGDPILVGRIDIIKEKMKLLNINDDNIEILNASNSTNVDKYIENLYNKNHRNGMLIRDCNRLVKTNRNVFASCVLEAGDADIMITGLTRNYKDSEQEVGVVIGKKDILFGTSVLMVNDRTLFISDTAINNNPSSTELVQIAKIIANNAKENNIKPRVAFIASDNFNKSENDVLEKVNKAIEILDKENVEFEYEGPISAEVALNEKLRNNNYPFSRLTDDANILIMPNLDSAKIAYHLLKETSKAVSIGPILSGFEYPVQILPIGSSVKQIINITAITCYNKICCDF